MDRESHSTLRNISPRAKASISALLAELSKEEAEAIESIHRDLDSGSAKKLDDAVVSLYAESQAESLRLRPRPAGFGIGSPRGAASPSLPTAGALGSVSPMFTGPVDCYYSDPDSLQQAVGECGDGGGEFNLDTCECDYAGGGGGGCGGTTGQTLWLVSEDCFHPDPDGYTPYGVGWGNGMCFLSQMIDRFPPGCSCVSAQGPSGMINCWQTNENGCVTTTCPINNRTADSACTQFIDGITSAEVIIRTGCQ